MTGRGKGRRVLLTGATGGTVNLTHPANRIGGGGGCVVGEPDSLPPLLTTVQTTTITAIAISAPASTNAITE